MQTIHSLKVYMAVFLSLLYILSPLNEEILEISHSLAHEIKETSTKHTHSHPRPHTHHTHTHEKVQNSVHTIAHQHEVLDFISAFLKVEKNSEIPPTEQKKDKYDKHLVQYPGDSCNFYEPITYNNIPYLSKSYPYNLTIHSPPPEFS